MGTKYIHPFDEGKVAINKVLLARVIELLDTDKYDQERRNIVYELEEVLTDKENETA